MNFDRDLLDDLTRRAEESPRLRMAFDLRNSAEDNSQRILNAMEPGMVLPIHRHRASSEVVIVLRGAMDQHLYDAEGNETDCVHLVAGSDQIGMSVPAGQWHHAEALEHGTVIFEAKDGKYEPLTYEDIFHEP